MAVRCTVAENNYVTASLPFEYVVPHSDNVNFNLHIDLSFYKQKSKMTISYYDNTNVSYFNQMVLNDGVNIELIEYSVDDLLLSEDIESESNGVYSEKSEEAEVVIDYSDLLPIYNYDLSERDLVMYKFIFELEDNYIYRLHCLQGDWVLGLMTDNKEAVVNYDTFYESDDPCWVFYDGAIGMKEDGDSENMVYGYYELDNSKYHKQYFVVQISCQGGDDLERINATVAEMFLKNYIRLEKVTK